VDSSGAILTTSDGLSWTNRPIARGLRDVTFGEGMFVAVGQAPNGVGRVFTSRNAVNWVQRSFVGGGMKGVTYGNGMFVAVGPHAIYLSPNGVQWLQVRSVLNATLRDVAFGNATFVAVAVSSSDYVPCVAFRSQNGVSWIREPSPDVAPWDRQALFAAWNTISFANGFFYVPASPGYWWASTNGSSWTNSDLAAGPNCGITFGAGILEAVGTSTPYYDTPPATIKSVAYGNGRFIAVGPGGTVAMSLAGPRSDYNNRWRNISGVSSQNLVDVEYGNGLYVAFSNGGMLIASSNGLDWVRQWLEWPNGNLTGAGITALAFGNGRFVAVGPSWQYMATSSDGRTWKGGLRTLGSDGFTDIAFGNGMFMAVGYTSTREYGLVLVSSDGTTWTGASRDIYRYGPLVRVDFDGTYFVVTRKDGTLMHTSDGQTWVQGGPAGWEWPVRSFDTPHGRINAITSGPHGTVAIGDRCLILHSSTSQ
jgi:hypothetical protein